MTGDVQKKKRYVFQVTRNDVIRTEIIKATSREEAEKTLAESDPHCTFKLLWVKPGTRTEIEKESDPIRVFVLLVSGSILLLTGFLLWVVEASIFRYLIFTGAGCLVIAALMEWWQNRQV